jgi:hypothetical protein
MSTKTEIEVPELGPNVPRWEKGDEKRLFPECVGYMTVVFTEDSHEFLQSGGWMGFKHLFPSISPLNAGDTACLFACHEHATKGPCFMGATFMEFWQVLRKHIVGVSFEFSLAEFPGMHMQQGSTRWDDLLISCSYKKGKAHLKTQADVDFSQDLGKRDDKESNFLFYLWTITMWQVAHKAAKRDTHGSGKERVIGVVNGFIPHYRNVHFDYEPEN